MSVRERCRDCGLQSGMCLCLGCDSSPKIVLSALRRRIKSTSSQELQQCTQDLPAKRHIGDSYKASSSG